MSPRRPFLLALIGLPLLLLAQTPHTPKNGAIKPDGIKATHEEHRVDLSGCDQVTIKVAAEHLQINFGKAEIYAWKKYGYNDLEIICTIEK